MPLILPDSRVIPCSVRDSTTVTTEALRGLTPDTIVHEVKRLQDSVSRLRDSNRQIEQFVHESGSELSRTDQQEMENACQDNQGTISRQQEVVDRLISVLSEKVDEDQIEQYLGNKLPHKANATTHAPMEEDETGVFL